MSIIYTQEQQAAIDGMVAHLRSGNTDPIILTGIAGTGKSTVINAVENIVHERGFVYSATTNKAAHSLAKAANRNTQTIHKLLNIRPHHITKKLIQWKQASYSKHTVVIVDEASMVDEDLYDMITSCCAQVIFVGDDTQLTPVGLSYSPAFSKGHELYRLSQPMRQRDAKHLAQVSMDLHLAVRHQLPTPRVVVDGKEIKRISRDEFHTLAVDRFTNGSPDDYRILCATNSGVKQHNSRLLLELKGRKEVSVGDIVINNYYVDGLGTDELVHINDVYPKEMHGHEGTEFDVTSILSGFRTTVFKARNQQAFKKDTRHLPIDQQPRIFDLRPAYSSTVHKAQGSTFQEVFIDLSTFASQFGRGDSLNRLLYVAFSRAKDVVYLVGDITGEG